MELPESSQLFVYSSLREGFHNKAYDYISHYFSFVCNAKTKGILSDIGSHPVCTPTLENSFIKGELYKLNDEKDFSWVFGQLDDYEGVIASDGEQPLYHRELTTVYQGDGNCTQAWIYWYNGDVSGKPVIASGDVLEYIKSKIN
jgi:gamma-glutamylcyclotransferase (GGCT)/AIG2-like uncharacterized protein YtfP